MKASVFIVILLLYTLLLPQSHGIRLGKRLTFAEEEEAQQSQMYQVEAPNLNSDDAEADIDDGHGGVHYSYENTQWQEKNRKLLTAATSSSSKGHAKAEFFASSSTTEFEPYHDIADIAEMDYSPAKRKPPIHN